MTDTTDERPAALDAAQRVQAHDKTPLVMWVIYREPADMPDVEYLARKWEIRAGVPSPVPLNHTIVAPLQELRRVLAADGLHAIARYETDDPVIVECWL
jgi:hypothetical protein